VIPSALLDHPHSVFTPHLGSATRAARQAIEAEVAANILAGLGVSAP
jgi:phosphoglycerate dehydrogenase-like enzyme